MANGQANYVGLVQEFTQKNGLQPPKYVDPGGSGPDHLRSFICIVSLPGLSDDYQCTGYGARKKVAKTEAAELLHAKLVKSPPNTNLLVARRDASDGRSPASSESASRAHALESEIETDCHADAARTAASFAAMVEPYNRHVQASLDTIIRSGVDTAIPLQDLLVGTSPVHQFAGDSDVKCQFHKLHKGEGNGECMTILFTSAGGRMERIVTHGSGNSYAESCRWALLSALHHMDVLKIATRRRPR